MSQRVIDVTTSQRVIDQCMRLLHRQVARMQILIAEDAPIALIAEQCGSIGGLERALDPEGWAQRAAAHMSEVTRRRLGICQLCEHDARPSGLCDRHERAMDDEVDRLPTSTPPLLALIQ